MYQSIKMNTQIIHAWLDLWLYTAAAHHRSSYFTHACGKRLYSSATNPVGHFCNPPGWRLQPTCGSRALVSPPLISSRHRILEPYGRWHATIHI